MKNNVATSLTIPAPPPLLAPTRSFCYCCFSSSLVSFIKVFWKFAFLFFAWFNFSFFFWRKEQVSTLYQNINLVEPRLIQPYEHVIKNFIREIKLQSTEMENLAIAVKRYWSPSFLSGTWGPWTCSLTGGGSHGLSCIIPIWQGRTSWSPGTRSFLNWARMREVESGSTS